MERDEGLSRALPSPAPLTYGRRPSVVAARAAIVLALALISALTLIPLVWLVAAAFKSPSDLFHYTFFSPKPSVERHIRSDCGAPSLVDDTTHVSAIMSPWGRLAPGANAYRPQKGDVVAFAGRRLLLFGHGAGGSAGQ